MSLPSPCTLVCALDQKTGWCRGCARTGAEIAAWPDADDDTRRAILARLPDRLRRLNSPSIP